MRHEAVRWSWDGRDLSVGVSRAGSGATILLLPALSSISTRRSRPLLEPRRATAGGSAGQGAGVEPLLRDGADEIAPGNGGACCVAKREHGAAAARKAVLLRGAPGGGQRAYTRVSHGEIGR
jgi:hypothetical protein